MQFKISFFCRENYYPYGAAIKRLIQLVPQLQFVAALALVLADNFACPSLRDRQIVHEQVAAVWLCYDDRTDDVLIRL